MLEDKLGSDPGLTDVHLRTTWEGIHFVHSDLSRSIKMDLLLLCNTMTFSVC